MPTATRRARFVQAWREGLPGAWDVVLVPAALAYRGGLVLRRVAYASGIRRTRGLPCRVVAVGNLTLGGTGKTPLVMLLAAELTARGRRVVVLSRGYGGRASAAPRAVSDGRRVLVDAREAGDEPVLLARRLPGVPVVVGRDRYRAGRWALEHYAPDLLLLDDGFQQRRLAKDVDVVCLDARAPWGRGGLFPRGSLREPHAALARAHLLVLTHAAAVDDLPALEAELARRAPRAPIARAAHHAEAVEDLATGARHAVEVLAGRRALGFAGIASPADFAATLAGLGVDVRGFVAFPDHHRYASGALAELEKRARAAGADLLLTTEKDAVRLPHPGGLPVWALRVGLRLDDSGGSWWAALEARLGDA